MNFTVTKYAYVRPVSIELLLDQRGDLIGPSKEPTFVYGWPLWLAKEWFKRGHGLGRTTPKPHLP